MNYCKEKKIIKKTEIGEFYWFNNSPNRFHKQQFVTEVEVCNCICIADFLCLNFRIKL